MDFLELAKKRYSVRAYKSTPVEDEKLKNKFVCTPNELLE